MIDRNFVYFSPAELAFTLDYFKTYLDDENTTGQDYTKECKELYACAEKYLKDKSCDYLGRLTELAERDYLAYHAYIYETLVRLCESQPDGIWISDPKVVDVFFARIKNGKQYFETRVAKA